MAVETSPNVGASADEEQSKSVLTQSVVGPRDRVTGLPRGGRPLTVLADGGRVQLTVARFVLKHLAFLLLTLLVVSFLVFTLNEFSPATWPGRSSAPMRPRSRWTS